MLTHARHVLGDVGPREPPPESLTAAAEAELRPASLEGGPELRVVGETTTPAEEPAARRGTRPSRPGPGRPGRPRPGPGPRPGAAVRSAGSWGSVRSPR